MRKFVSSKMRKWQEKSNLVKKLKFASRVTAPWVMILKMIFLDFDQQAEPAPMLRTISIVDRTLHCLKTKVGCLTRGNVESDLRSEMYSTLKLRIKTRATLVPVHGRVLTNNEKRPTGD